MESKPSLAANASAESAVADVVALLEEWGVAYLPGFLDDVSPLRKDFDRAVNVAATDGRANSPAPDEQGKNIAPAAGQYLAQTATGIHLKLDGYAKCGDDYPAVAEIFGCQFMRDIADSYLGRPNTLNRHIIFTHDFRGPAPEILPYHFDEMRSLKFYIYVDDVAPDDGAFQIIPGTHRGGRFIRMAEWHRTGSYKDIKSWVLDQYCEDYLYSVFGQFSALLKLRSVTLAGAAGSLIVFDTDSLHRGGPFQGDVERRVARGSSYTGVWP